MSGPQRVAAVVVAYNGGADLLACVASLLGQTLNGLEIIIVDNASSDGSIEGLEQEFGATVRIVRRSSNGGYAAGANTGWRAASAELVAILNQDLALLPDCLELMRDALVASENDALVTPKLVMKSNERVVNAIGNQVHLSGVAWCNGLATPTDDWHGVMEVTAISGAAFMASRNLLESLDGMEERYFMYYEDIDLSLRARMRGAICLAACEAVAKHDWQLTIPPGKFELLERNRIALWRRLWTGEPRMMIPLMQAETMAWMFAVLRGPSHLRAKWRATRTAMRLPRIRGATTGLQAMLARHHPYALMFPGRRYIQLLGRLADGGVSAAAGLSKQPPRDPNQES